VHKAVVFKIEIRRPRKTCRKTGRPGWKTVRV